ncbi:MAG: PIN domain-containing protein [Propionibacteriaceae bacterium]|nr:PIN domain-containing protein [Propionibacteriaceae bacterium]
MKRLYLVDNSVWGRVHLSDDVADAVGRLLETGELANCLPSVLEQGYSARSLSEHVRMVAFALGVVFLPLTREIADIAIDLQRKLFQVGKGRAVGVSDLQIAATAIHHSDQTQEVVVVHYDSDFDHLSEVEPRLLAHWVVPRGTIDASVQSN